MGFQEEDVEKLFYQDSIRKKRIGSGARHMSSKRTGSTGPMKTPVDYLKGKAKREYQRNGKVVTYNMYEKIMDYSEFKTLPKEEQRKILTAYRANNPDTGKPNFTSAAIREAWGLNTYEFYKLINDLGVPKDKSRISKANQAKARDRAHSRTNDVESHDEDKALPDSPGEQRVSEGLTVQLIGTYKGNDLVERLLALGQIFKEPEEYTVTLHIQEVDRKKSREGKQHSATMDWVKEQSS